MSSVHLHVLHHGMWGNSAHLAEAARHLRERFPKPTEDTESEDPEVDILVCQSNHGEGTYDGIDWGAERAVEEIDEKIRTIEESGRKVTRFSITGYSLGGLVARYIVGILHHREFFSAIAPVNFTTIATPHIGLLKYSTWYSKLSNVLGPRLLARTGSQFYAKDNYADTGRPLVDIMSDPDRLFYKALASFSRIAIYANGINDRTVPYVTAAFEPYDPFVANDDKNLNLEFEKGYEPLLKTFSINDNAGEVEEHRPKQTFSAWWESKIPVPLLGPFREWRFPMNIVVMALLPVLVPVFLLLVPTRFMLSSRSSRARVKLLEGDQESMARRLVTIWATLEKNAEDIVEDILEESILPATSRSANDGDQVGNEAGSTPTLTDKLALTSALTSSSSPANAKSQPLLTPIQLRIITNLNTLPNLTKHVAFINSVRNSHSIIICRNAATMPAHRRGEGILRAWADGMRV
ncbi:hypothetical protein PILCRDRAFT_812222 [Piloderma croceum F 1598]|uniref:DUF676 domain-containing protein n=1 Tax=Piloderma croceum (strain F 1598) TaxID=765440 RepID=A0A0C3CLC6_PILCF|nr:hypothetical protein PILCRDRAFT_812222 [Piloderma croceum F 1598]